MPTAFTVPAAASEILHDVEPTVGLQSWLVPELIAGVDPSVVYQMETLPCGTGVVEEVFPASLRVTVTGRETAPEAGEIVGVVVVVVEHEVEKMLPVDAGAAILLKPSDSITPPMFGPHTLL
jgi:hypothetical protein